MPIYCYKAATSEDCPDCHAGFEVVQKMNDERLRACPRCGAAVRRVITAPNLASASPSLDENNIAKHGFTQYRKAGQGVYEKTAGKGPDFIKGDES